MGAYLKANTEGGNNQDMRRGKIGQCQNYLAQHLCDIVKGLHSFPLLFRHIWCALVRPTQSCQMMGQVLATISSHNIQQEKLFCLPCDVILSKKTSSGSLQ